MSLYVSRPQSVEAVQWDGTADAVDRLWDFTDGRVEVRFDRLGDPSLYLLAGKDGAQKMVPVPQGHWVVHQPGDLTDIWPVDDDYFRQKYEPAQSDAAGAA